MLTIEEIKKVVEFADGFELHDCNGMHKIEYILECSTFRVNIQTMHPNHLPNYDLFLDRIIQGMNRKLQPEKDFRDMILSGDYLTILSEYGIPYKKEHNGTTEGIREAREKAIRFVLKEGV